MMKNWILVNKTETECVINFEVLENDDFFNGHFPMHKVLPGVRSLAFIEEMIQKNFHSDHKIQIEKLTRVKFLAPLLPDMKCELKIEKKDIQLYKVSLHSSHQKILELSTNIRFF